MEVSIIEFWGETPQEENMENWEKRVAEIRRLASDLNSQKITLRDYNNNVDRYVADLVEQSELDDPGELAFLRDELKRLVAVDLENAAGDDEFVVSYEPAPGGTGDEGYFARRYAAQCEYLARVDDPDDLEAAIADQPEVSGWDEAEGPIFDSRAAAERYAQALQRHGFNARVCVYR